MQRSVKSSDKYFIMKLFKHSVRDVFLVLLTMGVLSLAVSMAVLDPKFVYWLLLFPVHALLMLVLQNTSLHHHSHWATFNSKRLNEFYELFLSAASNFSAQTYRVVHTTHHKHVNDSPVHGRTRDPISVFQNGVNGEITNFWKFCSGRMIIILLIPCRLCWNFILGKKQVPVFVKYTQYRNESLAIVFFIALLACLNPLYALWYLLVVSVSLFFNYAWHYGEHWGAHDYRGDTTRDSVGIYNWLYNTLCFNSGYHQEHHHRPGVHWTRLPSLTPMLPPDRVRASGMHVLNNPYWSHLKKLFV